MSSHDPVSPFLRRVLLLDAVASAATGLLLAAGADLLAPLTGLEPALSRPAGLFLLPYAAFVAWLAMRPRPARPLVWTVIAANAVWAADSVLILLAGWTHPNALGVAFVLAQAAVVAGFAVLQYAGLRCREAAAAA